MRKDWRGFGFVLVVLVGLTSSGCRNTATEMDLRGSWQSNKTATLGSLVGDPQWANADSATLDRLNTVLGEMTNTFEKDTVVSRYKESSREYGYKILRSGEDWLEIEIDFGREPDVKRLQFNEARNAYWVDTGSGFSERFDRVAY